MAFVDVKSYIYLIAFGLICINVLNVASLTCFRRSTDRVREADSNFIADIHLKTLKESKSCKDDTSKVLQFVDQNDVTFCPNCSVCGIAVNAKNLQKDAALMPMTDEMDNLKPFEEFFKISNTIKSAYKVLTVCVMEKFWIRDDKEYNFRCMCNRNYCNGATNIIDYLNRQVSNDVAH
uniref:Uncharacterized protein n=1 Tax=Romanomermis culicivorax TaxID=13658 RepID=A0A915J136_ROMCU